MSENKSKSKDKKQVIEFLVKQGFRREKISDPNFLSIGGFAQDLLVIARDIRNRKDVSIEQMRHWWSLKLQKHEDPKSLILDTIAELICRVEITRLRGRVIMAVKDVPKPEIVKKVRSVLIIISDIYNSAYENIYDTEPFPELVKEGYERNRRQCDLVPLAPSKKQDVKKFVAEIKSDPAIWEFLTEDTKRLQPSIQELVKKVKKLYPTVRDILSNRTQSKVKKESKGDNFAQKTFRREFCSEEEFYLSDLICEEYIRAFRSAGGQFRELQDLGSQLATEADDLRIKRENILSIKDFAKKECGARKEDIESIKKAWTRLRDSHSIPDFPKPIIKSKGPLPDEYKHEDMERIFQLRKDKLPPLKK